MKKPNLQFDFLVDKENNTLTVRKAFAAERPLVWDCYTKSDLLDQWFAPKPWKTNTKTMNFSEGGYWLYAMCGPEGEEHYGRIDYQTIQPIDHYIAFDGFCDAEGILNPQLPRAKWQTNFTDLSDNTLVETVVTYNSLTDLETVLNMGMKEGIIMATEGLEALLETLKPTKKTVISIAANIKVAESTVWALYTTPEHIMQWNTASDDWHTTAATNDLRVGGSFSSTMAAKDGSFSFDFAGVYDVVKKNQTIAYTMGDDRKATITFTKKGDTTTVSIDFEAETQNSVELQRDGWQAILNNFKKYAEAHS